MNAIWSYTVTIVNERVMQQRVEALGGLVTSPLRTHSAATLAEASVWHHFVPLEGPAGQRWFIEFQDSGAEELGFEIDRVVNLLRRGQKTNGRRRLLEFRRRQLRLQSRVSPSIDAFLEESYLGALAYWQYREGDFRAARETIQEAQDAVLRAVEYDRFLLLFLGKILQLIVNEARVERCLCNWDRMWHLIEKTRGITRGHIPYGEFSFGTISQADLRAFCQRIVPQNELDQEALQQRLDPNGEVDLYDRLSTSASFSPFVVLPWI